MSDLPEDDDQPNFAAGKLYDDPLADAFDNPGPLDPRPPGPGPVAADATDTNATDTTASAWPEPDTPDAVPSGSDPDDRAPRATAQPLPKGTDGTDEPVFATDLSDSHDQRDNDQRDNDADRDSGALADYGAFSNDDDDLALGSDDDPFDDPDSGSKTTGRFRSTAAGAALIKAFRLIARPFRPVARAVRSLFVRVRSAFVRRYGLRTQIVAVCAIGALILSLLFSFASYALTRSSLLERRAELATTRAAVNAETVNRRLSGDLDAQQLNSVIDNLNAPEGTQPLLRVLRGAEPDDWLSANPLGFFEDDVDPGLQVAVDNGNAARMRYIPAELESHIFRDELIAAGEGDDTDEGGEIVDPDEEVHLVVAIPLTGTRPPAQYFEATSLREVEETLSSLAFTLFGVSALTTLAGIGLGFLFANRTLRPLGEISIAAQNIARGDLSTRLDARADRDLRILTDSFNEMATTLEEKVENDARFASEVSHELRSPLMTLTASVAVLEKRMDELPEKAQVAVELLSSDIERFKQLVEDLLEISRYDVGAAAAETQSVPIDEFVRQAVAFAGMLDVPVVVDAAAEGLFVDLDKRRLAQVIRNLLENAAKYAGGATEISIERDLDAVLIAVEDLGPGVPLKEREVIFERFSRGAEGGRRGSGSGVGLGLALVLEHIHLHGGSVWVTDRLDGQSGSRFVVRLPGVIERPRELL